MNKIIVIPSSIDLIKKTLDKVDGFILPLKDYSINYEKYFRLEEIISLIELLKNKDIFISLNKNFHNNELKKLNNVLKKLTNYKITGLIFYDIGLLNIVNKNNYKLDLVWAQEHMTTNSATINYWYDFNCKFTFLSNEITKNEIEIIKNNTNSKLLLMLFGYVPIFTSERHLVDNYLKTFDLKCDKSKCTINVENKSYPIIDNIGTTVFNNNIINGLNDIDIDYKVFNSYRIDDNIFCKVIDLYKNNEVEKINDFFSNIDKFFLYKETVYKVK